MLDLTFFLVKELEGKSCLPLAETEAQKG